MGRVEEARGTVFGQRATRKACLGAGDGETALLQRRGDLGEVGGALGPIEGVARPHVVPDCGVVVLARLGVAARHLQLCVEVVERVAQRREILARDLPHLVELLALAPAAAHDGEQRERAAAEQQDRHQAEPGPPRPCPRARVGGRVEATDEVVEHRGGDRVRVRCRGGVGRGRRLPTPERRVRGGPRAQLLTDDDGVGAGAPDALADHAQHLVDVTAGFARGRRGQHRDIHRTDVGGGDALAQRIDLRRRERRLGRRVDVDVRAAQRLRGAGNDAGLGGDRTAAARHRRQRREQRRDREEQHPRRRIAAWRRAACWPAVLG